MKSYLIIIDMEGMEQKDFSLEEVLFSFGKKKIWAFDNAGFREVVEPKGEDFFGRRLFVMQDHDKAGKIWDWAYLYRAIPKKSTLFHLDAHDDLFLPDNIPASLDDIWGQEYQIGSFILPRVNLGIIGNIVWVKPKGIKTEQRHSFNDRSFPNSIHSSKLLHQPKVSVIEEIQAMRADLLDIDLDFFTHGLSENCPNFFLKRRVKSIIAEIIEKISGSKIITIAISPGQIQTGREKVLLESVLNCLSLTS
jgi:hypothetical protein